MSGESNLGRFLQGRINRRALVLEPSSERKCRQTPENCSSADLRFVSENKHLA